MKVGATILIGLLCCQGCQGGEADNAGKAGQTGLATIKACETAQLLAYAPEVEEIQAHRQFKLPVIRYPYGTMEGIGGGLAVSVRLDPDGHPVCYGLKDMFGQQQGLNDRRQAVIGALSGWRYAPFVRDGHPVAALVIEHVGEEELPQSHKPLPDVRIEAVTIRLDRSGCLGACPSYGVEIHGDGRVIYEGVGFVDVAGRHQYTVPQADVVGLVDSLRAKDIWSLRDEYTASITDNPSYVLTITMGTKTKKLLDYVGQWVGMPASVSAFEDEVDRVARSRMWINLSSEGVEHLRDEGFKFDSAKGAELLARGVGNEESKDDEAMLALIAAGAPIDAAAPTARGFDDERGSLIEAALRNNRSSLVEPLIERGALMTRGKPDQAKIDAAFRAAIQGGRLALVQRIWQVGGDRPHPSLSFPSTSDDAKPKTARAPVTLLLKEYAYDREKREGLAITKWLSAQGCDLAAADADGRTLLHIASAAGDPGLVRYLLEQGIDPSTPGQFNLPALGSATNEDVALLLLQAKTDLSMMERDGDHYIRYATENHWTRVVAWLQSHGHG